MSYLYAVIIAVLKQAVRDYKTALMKNDFYRKQELEKFFLSEYGQAMSHNLGEEIIERCQRIVEKKKKKERQDNGEQG